MKLSNTDIDNIKCALQLLFEATFFCVSIFALIFTMLAL